MDEQESEEEAEHGSSEKKRARVSGVHEGRWAVRALLALKVLTY